MRRQHTSALRPAIVTLCATLSALAMSSSPAFADYRAWYAPWDYVGDFEPGDISEDYSEMDPPAGACGLRIGDPSYYRWTDDVGGTVTSADLYKDVIIWVDNPGTACSRPFSVRYADDSNTFSPPVTAVAMEISTNYAVHWVKDNGDYLYTCGSCAVSDDMVLGPTDNIWSLATVSAFKAVSGSLDDPRRQPEAAQAVAALTQQVMRLQALLQKQLTDRRRTTLGDLEPAVRALEDAAARSLAAARTSADTCDVLARQTRYIEAFAACTSAGDDVEDSDSLMRTAWFLYHPPSAPTKVGQ